MKKKVKSVFKWMGSLTVVILTLILFIIGVLAMPGSFFPEKKKYGSITVYSEKPIGKETDSIIAEVMLRLNEVPIYNPDKKYNLCFCSTQKKFSFFTRLTTRSNRIMGFCLLGSAFVNEEFINELGTKTNGKPKYLTREGSVVHVATHELMHGYINDAHGSIAARSLPEWKTEGYCEYGANQYVAPLDSGHSIAERIDIYLDNSQWNPTAQVHRPHYLWGLLMEYLINVKGMDFEQVMADNINIENVFSDMMDWHDSIKIQY